MIIIGANRKRIIDSIYVPSGPISYETHTTGIATYTSSVTVSKPSGILNNNLLLLLVGNDATDVVQFSQTNAPEGFTFFATAGGSTGGHYGIYYRIADGTEASSVTISPVSTSTNIFVFYTVFKNTSISGTILSKGTDYLTTTNTNTHTITGLTGNASDYGVYLLSFDGGDGTPFAVTSGTGWSETDEITTAVGNGARSSGCFGLKNYYSTTAVDVTISSNVLDGASGVQIRIHQE